MLLLFPRATVLGTSGFCKGGLFARRFILRFAPPADSFFLSRRPLMLCNLSWLPPRHEGMRALRNVGTLAAQRGMPLLFTLANFMPREATRQVYRTTHNFALSRLTNAPAYPKLRHSAKVCVAEEGKRQRAGERERHARLYIDTLRWERLIEIAAGIAQTVAEKNQSIRN